MIKTKKKAKNKKKKKAPKKGGDNSGMDMLHRVAGILEKMHIQDYMMLVNRPRRLIWVNLLAGLSRGVGFFFGTLLLSVILLYIVAKILGWIYADIGGLPWVGAHAQEFIGWILDLIHSAEESGSATRRGR